MVKEYTLKELGGITINLSDVKRNNNFDEGVQEERITSLYTPAIKLKQICSYCLKKKVINTIGGVSIVKAKEIQKNLKTGIFHQKFRCICDSCLTAMKI